MNDRKPADTIFQEISRSTKKVTDIAFRYHTIEGFSHHNALMLEDGWKLKEIIRNEVYYTREDVL